MDLSGVFRDTLAQMRAHGTPATRALTLVQLLPELPCDARGQLALALSMSLHAHELRGIARAGLLALDDACALVAPPLQSTARALLAAPLAARPRPSVHRGTLWCAEGLTSSEVGACAAWRGTPEASTRVLFVVSAADGPVSEEEAADLLAAEARLSDDASLMRFAVLASGGGLRVVPEAAVRPPPSLMHRVLAKVLAAGQDRDSTEPLVPLGQPRRVSTPREPRRLQRALQVAYPRTPPPLRAAHP